MPGIKWNQPSFADHLQSTTCVADAVQFLREALSNGPVPRAELETKARTLGISPSTLWRAQVKLHIKSQVVWRLP
jgi:hypothetical protein